MLWLCNGWDGTGCFAKKGVVTYYVDLSVLYSCSILEIR